MKNYLFKAATLCLSVAVLGACNKDKTTDLDLNAGSSSPAKDPIEQLRTFKKQIESVKANPEARSAETISLSDALWDVENTFNLEYSETELYYSQINDHEFTLTIPVGENHDVLVHDAANLYAEVVAQARNAFASDAFEDKGVVSLTIKETEEVEGLLHITFSNKTGERCSYNPPSAHIDGPFGIDDNWMFAAPLGKCDDPDIPSGADEQFQEKLYAELIEPFTTVDPGFRNIYIDRQRIIFNGYAYQGLFYTTNPDNTCIDHWHMNDHYSVEKNVISYTIPDQYHLIGYIPISIEIDGIILGDQALTHRHEIEYGLPLRVSTEEFGETKNLMCE